MTLEGLIATPFGYLLDGLYRMFGNYGLSVIIFAIIVQAVMVPVGIKNRRNREKKKRLKPMVNAIRSEYSNNPSKQGEMIAELYDKEKLSLVGSFLLNILPLFILVPIFQVVAQPITYMFHESPETTAAIVKTMREVAPELFTSRYYQATAISRIQDYAEIVKANVPAVSARTLEGLNYSFLGLDLGSVPGVHIIGKDTWAWDWAHIGLVLIPIVYMARRLYMVFGGMVRSLVCYKKEKKEALDAGLPAPIMPAPPILPLIFLFLSLGALFSIPVAMNVYWLTGGLASSLMHRFIRNLERHRAVDSSEAMAKKPD